jgi:hypothetical protein
VVGVVSVFAEGADEAFLRAFAVQADVVQLFG